MLDTITISDLQVHLAHGLGRSAFDLSPPPPCPVSLNIAIHLKEGIVSADEDTMLGLGVNYSAVSKQVYALVGDPNRTWAGPDEVLHAVGEVVLRLEAVQGVEVQIDMPRALLHARAARYMASFDQDPAADQAARSSDGGSTESARQISMDMGVMGLEVACVIGLHSHERSERQRLSVDIIFTGCGELRKGADRWSHKQVADCAMKFLENSSYGTIESLSHSLAEHLLESMPTATRSSAEDIPSQSQRIHLQLTIRKLSAVPFATPSITVYRSRDLPVGTSSDSARATQLQPASDTSSENRRIFVALGSNIGDSISHFRRAINLLVSDGCTVIGTGRIYESEPMYVTSQDRFTNTAIEIRSALDPMGLLHLLKRTEKAVGRVKSFENGPRVVDLDLIYYGDDAVRIGKKGDAEDEDGVGWLQVPHWGRAEREFVLRPLVDIAPDFIDPVLRVPLSTLLLRLPRTEPPPLAPLIPFPSPARPLRLSIPAQPRIMLIFNATPDSFSDGSADRLSVPLALSSLRDVCSQPFPPHVIDVGGMSTRPNSVPCSLEEELARTVPLIRAIRAESGPLGTVAISIDTYRPEVARAAVEAGASCINDVRGGREEGMLQVMAELDVPVVLMHSRGDSTTMNSATSQDYSALGGVVNGVRKEMEAMVTRALAAGVKKWNIILDPGLGFAKSAQDSLVLLRNIASLTKQSPVLSGYPVLVGASRKGFVGKVIGRDIPAERVMGDAAIASWCASSGMVDLLRVHDSRAAAEAVKMTLAIKGDDQA